MTMGSISVLGAVIAVLVSVVAIASLKWRLHSGGWGVSGVPYKVEPSETPLPQGFVSLDIINKYDRRSLTYTAKKHGILLDKDGYGFYVIHFKQVEQLVDLVKNGKITGKKLKATINTLQEHFKGGAV